MGSVMPPTREKFRNDPALQRIVVRRLFCSCYPSENCPEQPGVPKHPGIQGNVKSLLDSARCMVNRWAIENGLRSRPVLPCGT